MSRMPPDRSAQCHEHRGRVRQRRGNINGGAHYNAESAVILRYPRVLRSRWHIHLATARIYDHFMLRPIIIAPSQ